MSIKESKQKYRKKNMHVWRVAIWRKRGIHITWEEFLLLLREQDFKCAICETAISESSDLDHDHCTGSIRGILCRACNVGLGSFRDDPVRLERAVQYLNRERL